MLINLEIYKLIDRMSRRSKTATLSIIDCCILFLSFNCSIVLQKGSFSNFPYPDALKGLAVVLPTTLLAFWYLGIYRTFTRNVSMETVEAIIFGSAVSVLAFFLSIYCLGLTLPPSTPLIHGALTLISITCPRFIAKSNLINKNVRTNKRIAVYGAGAAGAQALNLLRTMKDYSIALVIDDDPKLRGKNLFGSRISSYSEAQKSLSSGAVDLVLLTMPSASAANRNKIISRLTENKIAIKTIPSLGELISGSVDIASFNEIDIADLLGRQSVQSDKNLMGHHILGRSVLVTGSGGSIGSELCRQILKFKPKRLVMLDISEFGIYQIEREIRNAGLVDHTELVPMVGSILDRNFVQKVVGKNRIDTIFHAAAYKHVPLMEQNVFQCVQNNVLGFLIVAEVAVEAGVENFTLISSDKAVRPTNVMGASKRLAERLCKGLAHRNHNTRFSIVRFGNVLGSSGSVVPLFKSQIKMGGPVTVTDTRATRYFMTIPEAAQLVVQTSAISQGGEVFVLDMGQPVNIYQLAQNMIKLSGSKPFVLGSSDTGDIAVEIIGLRPGEKLHEELSYDNNLTATSHPWIRIASEQELEHEGFNTLKKVVIKAVEGYDEPLMLEVMATKANAKLSMPENNA